MSAQRRMEAGARPKCRLPMAMQPAEAVQQRYPSSLAALKARQSAAEAQQPSALVAARCVAALAVTVPFSPGLVCASPSVCRRLRHECHASVLQADRALACREEALKATQTAWKVPPPPPEHDMPHACSSHVSCAQAEAAQGAARLLALSSRTSLPLSSGKHS